MFKNNVFKGIVFVAISAVSYGVLATIVKLSYQENFTTAEITMAQFLYGILGLSLVFLVQKPQQKTVVEKPTQKNIFQLVLAGTTIGLTSVLYYLAVSFVPVSVAVVMLMQTVWMGVVLEAILAKKAPSMMQILAVIFVFAGTFLAAKVFETQVEWNINGIIFGLLAAVSFTITKFTSNAIATHLLPAQRGIFMLLGGLLVVIIFTLITQNTAFNFEIFIKWGILVALFGTIIPPLFLNAGYPLTGLGLGSIVSSLELAVSVTVAYLLLHESISFLQIIGISLILFAIVLMNINWKKK